MIEKLGVGSTSPNLVLEGAILANEALLSWIRGWATGLPQEALISIADILNNAIVMAANGARLQGGHIIDAKERYEAAKGELAPRKTRGGHDG